MSTRASGTFNINSSEEDAYNDRDGAKLSRGRLTKTFYGDLEATSAAEMLMAQAQEGSAGYVALERIVGILHDRSGSFVLHHTASGSRGKQSGAWSVVPDSGTGELRRLHGQASIVVEPNGGHTITLDSTSTEPRTRRDRAELSSPRHRQEGRSLVANRPSARGIGCGCRLSPAPGVRDAKTANLS